MMPAELQTMLVLLLVSSLGSFVCSETGFGSALIAISLAHLICSLPFVLAVFALLDIVHAVRVDLAQSHAIGRDGARRLIPWGMLGVLRTCGERPHLVQAILGELWLAGRAHSRISCTAMIQGSRVLLLIARMSLVVRDIRGM